MALSLLLLLLLLLLMTTLTSVTNSQTTPPPLPLLPIPTSSQLRWQQSEMALFLHFGTNTFTDREWGTGHADPTVFRPTSLDAAQWVHTAAHNGFSKLILTAKHHDGFCLWPSAYTNYSVAGSTGWKDGKGDVMGELEAAAKEAGVGVGVYLSPWDRHDSRYGRTVEYNEFYVGQMTELLTRYGEIHEVWLDGAKGEGEKDMGYYFNCWFDLIHQLQPHAVIFSDAGPDTRWVGDEAGVAGTTCWSLFNQSSVTIGHTDDYNRVGDQHGRDWVPAECDVSIRPGWFWHSSEHPKSALTLLDIYYKSVGRNCLLLLNLPPNSSGLISDEDVQVLQEFTSLRQTIFSDNLAEKSIVSASSTRGGPGDPQFAASNVFQEGIFTYWAPDELQGDWRIFLDLGQLISFNVMQVQEPIQMGQRVIEFHVDVIKEGEWLTIVNGTTIGYKRLLQFPMVKAQFLRLSIDKSRADPLISYLGIYLDPYSTIHDASAQISMNDSQVIVQTPSKHSVSTGIASS